MNWLSRLVARRRLHEELAEEIQEHLDEKIADLIESGMCREDAVLAARRAFGNVTLTAERGREVWGWPSIETWWADARYGWRQLRKSPGFTLVAVVSSALGIGASTAVFCVMYAVLINPYPYTDPDRLVHLHVLDQGGFLFDLPLSSQQFEEFQHAPVLAAAMAMDVEGMAATGGDGPEPVNAGFLSRNAFDFLGVPPLLGRVFANDSAGQDVVLSYAYWQSHYEGQLNVLGQVLELDHKSHRIIGVMPRRFAWWNCDVYLPLAPSPDPDRLASVFARLKPGVDDDAAERALQSLTAGLARQRPNRFPSSFRIQVVHLDEIAAGQLSGTLTVIGGAVGLLLLIGCANISILLLARGTGRRHEIAVRVALGASRSRIVRQLLTESMLISIAGCALGILLARSAVDLVAVLLPEGTFPTEAAIGLSQPVMLFSASVALATGIIFGLWPAVQFSGQTVRLGSQRVASRGSEQHAHYLLIAGQVALTLVLLAGAGATGRVFDALLRTRLDYDPQGVTSIRVDLRDGTYSAWSERAAYYERIRRAVAENPAIASAAISLTDLPPAMPFRSSPIEIPDRPALEPRSTFLSEVSAEYFSTLRIPLVQGRAWSAWETSRAVPFAVVNASLAERYWPGASPLGQLIHLPGLKATTSWAVDSPWNDGWVEIVGVAADTPNTGLRDPTAPTVYVPFTLVIGDSFRVITRTTGPPLAAAGHVAEQIHAIDPNQPISQIRTAADLLDAQGWARERLTASLFAAFAFLGVMLSAVGLYSVVSYVVSQRAQEFGIRMALGARRVDVIRLVLKSALEPTATGVTVGLGLCIIVNHSLVQWVHATVRDPYVIAPMVIMLVSVATLAGLVPAWRAACANPATVLRAD